MAVSFPAASRGGAADDGAGAGRPFLRRLHAVEFSGRDRPARKIGGALGSGCSLIIKASEETPGTCVEIVGAFHDAGLPKGVLNLVFGVPARISEHLIASPLIRKVSFTGSVPVGKHLTKLAADGMKRTTMELGGHSPVIVFGDADPEKSAELAAAGKFRNAGQVCISPTRFYVQENNYDRFVKRFVDYAKNLKLGDGLADGTTMGPLANPRRLDAMEGFVADAEEARRRDRGPAAAAPAIRASSSRRPWSRTCPMIAAS